MYICIYVNVYIRVCINIYVYMCVCVNLWIHRYIHADRHMHIFPSSLPRGVYLATVFYHKENILVTAEDQIPLVEIHCCSTSIIHNFPWFAKVGHRSDHAQNMVETDFR